MALERLPGLLKPMFPESSHRRRALRLRQACGIGRRRRSCRYTVRPPYLSTFELQLFSMHQQRMFMISRQRCAALFTNDVWVCLEKYGRDLTRVLSSVDELYSDILRLPRSTRLTERSARRDCEDSRNMVSSKPGSRRAPIPWEVCRHSSNPNCEMKPGNRLYHARQPLGAAVSRQ